MKTSELTGAALDWAVCKTIGLFEAYPKFAAGPKFLKLWQTSKTYFVNPSSNWLHGGPIIKRNGISLLYKNHNKEWHASIDTRPDSIQGQYLFVRWHPNDPLIAAMRCVVASKLGDEVDIPKELLSWT